MAERMDWALVLGASSGFGAACSIELAAAGFNIFGVHLDRRVTLPNAERVIEAVRAHGREAVFFNENAADPQKRAHILDRVQEAVAGTDSASPVRVLLHSLAFGTLRLYIDGEAGDAVNQAQMEMTVDVMANSLVYWTQDLVRRELIGAGGRIFAMTSEGSTAVIPYYGAVSAAKAALEAHTRQLALELAPRAITVNAIRAGVTETPALMKIPGYQTMIERALTRNPHRRLTRPEDVAKALVLLTRPESAWITGNVIGVDGGEAIAG